MQTTIYLRSQSEEEYASNLVDEFQRLLELGSDFFLKRNF